MKRPSEKMHERAALLRSAAKSLDKLAGRGRATIDEIGDMRLQARACRREAGLLIRRARQLANLETR